MSYKSRTKEILSLIFDFAKPFLFAGLTIAVLQMTGLMGAASYATQWTLLQTGIRDADEEVVEEATAFDYAFTIKDLEGNRVSVEDFKGKVIFLNMWATWCGPCRAEMPSIQKLYEKVDKEKIVFIMLSIDKDSDLQKVTNYMTDKGFTFQAYLPSGSLPNQLRVPSIPTTFVISKDGKVVKKEVGSMRYDTREFEKFLEELSAE